MTETERKQREHLEQCSGQLAALADEIDGKGTAFRELVASAFELDGTIRELSGRISVADVNQVGSVLDQLSAAVKRRKECQARAQELQQSLSANSHSLRHLAGQVRPKRLLDTVGRKLFHNA